MADTDIEQAEDTGIGATLQANRRRRGITLDAVAQALNVRKPFLQAIEEGRYEALPGPTYACGFVRAYADYLGLSNGEAVRQFKIETLGRKIGGDLNFPSPESERGVPRAAILVASVLLIGLAYGAWYLLSPQGGDDGTLIAAVPERLAPTPAGEPARLPLPVPESPGAPQAEREQDAQRQQPVPAAVPPDRLQADLPPTSASLPPLAVEPGEDAPSGTSAGGDNSGVTDGEPSAYEPPPALAQSAPEPAAEPQASPAVSEEGESAASVEERIVLRASAPTWIELRDRNGRIFLSKVLQAGDMLPVDAAGGLSLVTGNAGGLEIVLGGKVLPPLGRSGQVRRGIVLDPAALRSAAAR